MAKIKPGESALVLYCETGHSIIELWQAANLNIGIVLGVDPSRAMIQQAINQRASGRLPSHISLVAGDPCDARWMSSLESRSNPGTPPTFDLVFARNILPPVLHMAENCLRLWIRNLRPNTGRLLVTFPLGDETAKEVGSIECSAFWGEETSGINLLLEREWKCGEREFEALVGRVGLQIESMQRVGFENEWTENRKDISEDIDRDAERSFLVDLAAGNLTTADVSEGGTLTPHYKKVYKLKNLEKIATGLICGLEVIKRLDEYNEGYLADALKTVVARPWTARLASVLKLQAHA